MRESRKLTALGLVLLLAVALSPACKKQVTITDLPPGVSEKQVRAWYEATGYVAVISEGNKNLTDAVVAMKQEENLSGKPIFSPEAYQTLLEANGRIAQGVIHISNVLNETPNNFGKPQADRVQAEFNTLVSELQKANTTGLTGVKNEESRQRLNSFLTKMQAAVQGFRLLLAATGGGDQ